MCFCAIAGEIIYFGNVMRISCPKCGQACELDDKYAGQAVKCSSCKIAFEVPAAHFGVVESGKVSPLLHSESAVKQSGRRVSRILFGIASFSAVLQFFVLNIDSEDKTATQLVFMGGTAIVSCVVAISFGVLAILVRLLSMK